MYMPTVQLVTTGLFDVTDFPTIMTFCILEWALARTEESIIYKNTTREHA